MPDQHPSARVAAPPATPPDALRAALVESRKRLRGLVALAADFAFETDAWGRFAFVTPDPALGWAAGMLIGQPASLLLADGHGGGGFDPFRVTVPVRHKRVWLKRGDGGVTCLGVAAEPLLDATGSIIGVRGIGTDITDTDRQAAQVTASLRRAEVLDHILTRVGAEVLAPRMMKAALEALTNALGCEGAAVVLAPSDGTPATLAHQCGAGAPDLLPCIMALLPTDGPPRQTFSVDGRPMLVAGCQTRFGDHGAIAVWRPADARAWDHEERQLVGSSASIVRMVLEHEAIQREMYKQARIDPLTGLLNRRAFLEDIARHIERLDREHLPGALMFADVDNFKPVNDTFGHEIGDLVLVRLAEILRQVVRPSDVIARLGGDEFAIWMSGADHMTAAERAEALRLTVPAHLAKVIGGGEPKLTLSIGIACRAPDSPEALDGLIRRADMAMYHVKRNGRAHWHVALEEPA